jgi:hypothetical protein
MRVILRKSKKLRCLNKLQKNPNFIFYLDHHQSAQMAPQTTHTLIAAQMADPENTAVKTEPQIQTAVRTEDADNTVALTDKTTQLALLQHRHPQDHQPG